MGIVQDYCPPEILAKSEYFDTLYVAVPYKGTDEVTVAVPPIANNNDPLIKSISDNNIALTQEHGEYPVGYKQLVGWLGDDEKKWRDELEEKAQAILDAAKSPNFHPAPKEPVEKMAGQALFLIGRIKNLYQAWARAMMPTENPGTGKYAVYERDMSLDQSTDSIRDWANILQSADQEEFNALVKTRMEKFADVIGDVSAAHYAGDATKDTFWNALLAARKRDRNKIRSWYQSIHKNLYCAEYGVAQSDSYNGNKSEHGGDALPLAPGPVSGPRKPTRFRVIGGFAPPLPPVPPTDEAPPDDLGWPGGDLPDIGAEEPLPWPEGAPPPITAIAEIEPEPVPWHKTLAAKVGLAVVGVAAAGGIAYGIYRYQQRRSAPTF